MKNRTKAKRGSYQSSAHKFSSVPSVDIPRSTFRRDHGHKTTLDAGYLVPFYVDEALPGDTFSCNATLFARLATPITPIMDNMTMETFFFAVPYRLLWDNFQRFMGEVRNPGDSTDFLVPTYQTSGQSFTEGSLGDYFGLPINTDLTGQHISALPFRAYNLIWNDWFRDQNLQDSLPVSTNDGPDVPSAYLLRRRGKRHDYFTSALPWPQKGPGVELPLGDSAPVSVDPAVFSGDVGDRTARWRNRSDGDIADGGSSGMSLMVDGAGRTYAPTDNQLFYDPQDTLMADLSDATAATINSLRQAFQMQKLLERDARGGTRYTEIIQSHFRVRSPDARLQRPEYLGGGSAPVRISPVPQMSSTDDSTPQGNLAAFGIVGSDRNGFHKSFTEHCVVIGLVNVRADLTYQQNIPRMFSRRTKYDFYWPALAHLGEQAILQKEIYFKSEHSDPANDPESVFGYQERWSEYRYYPSKVTGRFRSAASGSLDVWHLAQDFANAPVLSSEFIQDDPPIKRALAVPTEPDFLLDCHLNLKTARPMPTYSVPGMIDHF